MHVVEGPDKELVERSLDGDRDAFSALIRRHEGAAFNLIRYRLAGRDGAEADDVYQNTILKAWLRLEQLRDPSRFRAWLMQIARNCCREYYRSQRGDDVPLAEPEPGVPVSRYGRGLPPALNLALNEAVAGLPEEQEAAVRLFYFQGFSIRDIAATRGCPEGTVKSRLYSARNHLRQELGIEKKGRDGKDGTR